MSNPQEWFYLEGQDRKGPFDHPTMLQLLQAGVIRQETWVAREGDADWATAKTALLPEASTFHTAPQTSISPTISWVETNRLDLKLLTLAGIILATYFVVHCFAAQSFLRIDVPREPGIVYEAPPIGRDLFKLFLIAGLPALALGWVQRIRLGGHVKGRKPSGKSTALLIGLWVVVVPVWIYVGLLANPTKWAHSIVWMFITGKYPQGAPMSGLLFLYSMLFIAIIGSATAVGEKVRRRIVSLRHSKAGTTLLVHIARIWTLCAAILSLFTLLRSGSLILTLWPPRDRVSHSTAPEEIANNTSGSPVKMTLDAPVASLDVSTPEQQVETLIKAISTYQQKHGGTLARDWGSLVPAHARRDYGGGDNYDPHGPTDANPHPLSAQGENICNRSNDGDLDGPVRGKLLELLTGDKSDLASQAIFELNVDGFFVLLDGNADGKVSLLDIPINARALAWSSGPNGINESGAGDDFVRLLK